MRILITGSSGMLGTELCEVLGEECEITGVDIVSPRCPVPGLRNFYKASITDFRRIEEIFAGEKPELVIHAAAWTDVDGCETEPEKAYEINTAGTHNIARALGGREVPVIFIGTDFVFDGQKDAPYTESDVGHPLSVYGKTKWEAEKILESSLSYYAIVRTSGLYGKNGKNFVDTILAKARLEGRLRVVNDQVTSPTYARDLARALKELVRSPDGFRQDIFHVSNSGWCSWYDFALCILKGVKDMERVMVEPITSSELSRPAPRPGFSALDSGKFQRVTGHRMRSWREALTDYLQGR